MKHYISGFPDLSFREWEGYMYLSTTTKANDGDSPSLRDLAEVFNLSHEGVSQILDRLESKNYLRRKSVPRGLKAEYVF